MFELFESIVAKPKRTIATQCDQCHNKAPVRRCISAGGGVIFKGSGFYATDYRSDGYNKAAKADKEAAEGKSSDKKTNDKSSTKSSDADSKKGSAKNSGTSDSGKTDPSG